jgi:Alpha-glucosidases, family 31 of glycosyl hydrolases
VAEGGQKRKVTTVLNRIPRHVRAGSIAPLGPDVQYVTEKKWDNLKVRVYPGADGQSALYEDEGNN